MKRLHTGLIVFDTLDIICISFSAGASIAHIIKKYRKFRRKINEEDPIVTELKENSSAIMFSEEGKPLKFPLVRGGDNTFNIRGFSLVIRNKKLAKLIMAIVYAKNKQKQLKLLI